MIINRDKYLNRLIKHKYNKRIKVITGIRRSGKSFLLNSLFVNHLFEVGVEKSNIIRLALDDIKNKKYRDPNVCYQYITSLIKRDSSNMYYVLIDEVQMMIDFVDVLNGFLHIDNIDVYITGSNSRFLSSDVVTEFRGRGDEIRVYPLSFREFYSKSNHSFEDALKQFYTYGGLPYILYIEDEMEKINYLNNLFSETYLQDIIERNGIKNDRELEILIDIIASSVGSLTNPQRISNTFKSVDKTKISAPTIKKYIDHLKDAFLIEEAKRYDIKGRKYIGTPSKYYFEDIGLRNARLNFRQQEQTHIMENIIYNELKYRGFAVDVGLVNLREKIEGKYQQRQVEVDFVANRGSQRYYIQSAYHLPTHQKRQQEERPLLNIADSFKKIIIVNDNIMLNRDDKGVVTMSLKDFFMDENSLDF